MITGTTTKNRYREPRSLVAMGDTAVARIRRAPPPPQDPVRRHASAIAWYLRATPNGADDRADRRRPLRRTPPRESVAPASARPLGRAVATAAVPTRAAEASTRKLRRELSLADGPRRRTRTSRVDAPPEWVESGTAGAPVEVPRREPSQAPADDAERLPGPRRRCARLPADTVRPASEKDHLDCRTIRFPRCPRTTNAEKQTPRFACAAGARSGRACRA